MAKKTPKCIKEPFLDVSNMGWIESQQLGILEALAVD